MSSGRPGAPSFAYSENRKVSDGNFLDLLQNVSYIGVDDGNVTMGITLSEGILDNLDSGDSGRILTVVAESSTVPPGDTVRGPLNLIPFIDLDSPFVANVDSITAGANLTNLHLKGSCAYTRTDLLTTPIIVYTNSFEYNTSLDTMYILENRSLYYDSPAADYFGLVNNSTGIPENWNSTFGSAPVFSEVGWFVYNCRVDSWYTPKWYGSVFHEFPRFHQDNFFVYPASSSHKDYMISLCITAVPLVCIGGLVVLFEPFVLLLNSIGRLRFLIRSRIVKKKRQREQKKRRSKQAQRSAYADVANRNGRARMSHRFGGERLAIELSRSIGRSNSKGLHTNVSSNYEDEDTDSDSSAFDRPPRTSSSTVCRCCSCCCCKKETTVDSLQGIAQSPTSPMSDGMQSRASGVLSQNGSSGRTSMHLLGLTAKEKRREALRLRMEILELNEKLSKTLLPSSFLRRAFLILLLILALVEVPVGITLALAFHDLTDDFYTEAKLAQEYLTSAHELATNRQSRVQEFSSACGSLLSDAAQELISTEQIELAEYINLVRPSNLVPADANLLGGLRYLLLIVWQGLNSLLCLMVVASIWSGVLTYCRFTWGDEKIVCQRPSFFLGRCLQPFIIIITSLCWIAIGLFTIIVSVMSDACAQPSFVQVNTSLANYQSSADAQYNAQIYNFRTTFSQVLRGDNRTHIGAVSFNVGSFLSNCYTAALIFNPYTYILQLANEAHLEVVESLAGQSISCDSSNYTASGFYSPVEQHTRCEQIADGFGAAITNLCQEHGLWQLFTFYVSLILFTLLSLIVYSNSRELTPNLFRMHNGKSLQARIQQMQSNLRDLLQDQGITTDAFVPSPNSPYDSTRLDDNGRNAPLFDHRPARSRDYEVA
mmetsp:Transcript_18841/g.36968  ORF Transcript_18841/g.36968 Transcript_18841/m.36968 type:complete len:882 (-) Transcript_18841:274-2919(-)